MCCRKGPWACAVFCHVQHVGSPPIPSKNGALRLVAPLAAALDVMDGSKEDQAQLVF